MTRGPINQEVGIPPPLGFPHTILNVKRVKDNMQLTFIEKLFTKCEIGTSVQTRYLCFKGMSYKSERYLCDINYVQLRKVLAWFRCGNTQLEDSARCVEGCAIHRETLSRLRLREGRG
jgi:hypothetical protein